MTTPTPARHETGGEGSGSPEPEAKRSRTATRARLMEASLAVFVERGIDNASVAQLCAAAGFTRGAFYSNFASKIDLALAVYAAHVERLEAIIEHRPQELLREGVPPAEVVDFTLGAISGLQNSPLWLAFQAELLLNADRLPQVRENVDAQYQRVIDGLTRCLEQARAYGMEYRIAPDRLATLLISVRDGQLLRLGAGAAPDMGADSPDSLLRTVWDSFVTTRV